MQTPSRWIPGLLSMALALAFAGCDSGTSGRKSSGYESQMAVSVELIDPETGHALHATMDQMRPAVLLEAARITTEPILRRVLTKPSVQQTKWFDRFDGNLDKALADLRDDVLYVEPAEDTPLIRIYATTANEDDAQIILTALRDEYMRQYRDNIERITNQSLDAAHRRKNAAEEKITSVRGAIKRFLTNTPIETLDESTSEAAIQVEHLIAERITLNKRYNTAQAEYASLTERQQGGDFDPSDTERQQIEKTASVVEIKRRVLDARIKVATLRAEADPDDAEADTSELKKAETQLLVLEREYSKMFEEQWRILFSANLERTAIEMQSVKEQLQKTTQALAEWTVKRQENIRLFQEYTTLTREHEAAQAERDLATTRIADLLEATQNERITSHIVREEFPPQKAAKR